MIKLNKPDFDVSEVYPICVDKKHNSSDKADLQKIEDKVVVAEAYYNNKATENQLHVIGERSSYCGVGSKVLSKLYTERFAGIKGPGRPYYDQLRLSSPYGTCPICGHREVSTLDHYLPKENYPQYAITPNNLVPSCPKCNQTKGEFVGSCDGEMLFHPYFDDFDSIDWLEANVVEELPATITFGVRQLDESLSDLRERILSHVNHFDLLSLFTSNANRELTARSIAISNLANAVDLTIDRVREFLLLEAETASVFHRNTWKGAMYRSLSENDWYCGGGFGLGFT